MGTLDDLPIEILLKIFKYLDLSDLCRLRQSCKKLNILLNNWIHVLVKNNDYIFLHTKSTNSIIINRSQCKLSNFEKLRVARNWRLGRYKERFALSGQIRFLPWIQLEKDLLWVSRGHLVTAYKRNQYGIGSTDICCNIKPNTTRSEDVSHFAVKNNLILGGQTSGTLWLWSRDKQRFLLKKRCHQGDVNAVDLNNKVLVSGSRDQCVKIWRNPQNNEWNDVNILEEKIDFCDRIWSVRLCSENDSLLAIGTSAMFQNAPQIMVYDMEKKECPFIHNVKQKGDAIFDLKWQNPNSLWTCSFDGNLERWDLRSGQCEQKLEDPCGSALYCFEHDGDNIIISGAQDNGRAVLWDVRQRNCVQTYYMKCCRSKTDTSPIYGLSFDAKFLFTATDKQLNILDFSTSERNARDYSEMFSNVIKT